jgi:hypothetical protein
VYENVHTPETTPDDGTALLASVALLDAKPIHKEIMAARQVLRKQATITRNEAKAELKKRLKEITALCEMVAIPESDFVIQEKWTALRRSQYDAGVLTGMYEHLVKTENVGNNNEKLHRVLHECKCVVCGKPFWAKNNEAVTGSPACRQKKLRDSQVARLETLIGDDMVKANLQELNEQAKATATALHEELMAKKKEALVKAQEAQAKGKKKGKAR